MDSSFDILIPEKGGRIGSMVAESLRTHGLAVRMMDDSDVLNDEPGFIRHLKAELEECSPRMIMPIFKAEFIARHRTELPQDIIIPTSNEKTLKRLDSKCQASALACSLGIPQPRIYGGADEISDYPVVFKRDQGLSGAGVYFPKGREALEHLIESTHGKPYLICEFTQGYDVCVDAIRWRNYFHAECYRVLEPRCKGISTLRESVSCPEIVEHLRSILEATDYEGVCGADFRMRESDGKPLFLECNPRFSGGISTQIASGFDMPFILWQLATGTEPHAVDFREGVIDSNE